MRAYIDTNILVDLVHAGDAQLMVSALSFINTVYIGKKYKFPIEDVFAKLRLVADFVDVVDLRGQSVVDMLNSSWKDYEDATQYRSAVDEQADCIVTRNKKDFKDSTIEVLTPAEFFDKLESNPT